jgi:raffinose/stachyose/melibiose transport system substrate-binding protein
VDFPAMPDMKDATPGANVGGTIVGYIMAANQSKRQLEASIEWVKVMASPEMWVRAVESSKGAMPFLYAGKVPNFDWSKYAVVQKELADAFTKAPIHVPSMDAWAPPAVDLAIKKTAMPGLISGEFNVDKALAEVQKAAVEYLKTAKK